MPTIQLQMALCVLCFGDSLLGGGPEVSIGGALEQLLQAAGVEVQVISRSYAGKETHQLLSVLPSALGAFHEVRPDVVVLLGGYNNITHRTGRAEAVEDAFRDLREMVSAVHKVGSRCILVNLPPLTLPKWQQAAFALNIQLRSAGADAVADTTNIDPRLRDADGMHWSAAANAEFAKSIFKTLQTIMPNFSGSSRSSHTPLGLPTAEGEAEEKLSTKGASFMRPVRQIARRDELAAGTVSFHPHGSFQPQTDVVVRPGGAYLASSTAEASEDSETSDLEEDFCCAMNVQCQLSAWMAFCRS